MTTKEKLTQLQAQGLSIKFLSTLTNIKVGLLYKWNSGTKISSDKEQILNQTLDTLLSLVENNKKAKDSISYEDLSNQKFNHLTALYPIGSNQHGAMQWACQCDCGNPILKITTASCLKNGETVSCGCQRTKYGGLNFKDLTGQRFGKLLVLKRDKNDNSDRVQWLCQCDCGVKKVIRGKDLVAKKVQSCGCLKQSVGEYNIEQILKNENINYIKEYSFKDLKSPKGYVLRFDFAIFDDDNKLLKLIEFDGPQHEKKSNLSFNETEEDKQYRLLCDELKNNYCKNHNIALIRLSYDKRNQISKDLLYL